MKLYSNAMQCTMQFCVCSIFVKSWSVRRILWVYISGMKSHATELIAICTSLQETQDDLQRRSNWLCFWNTNHDRMTVMMMPWQSSHNQNRGPLAPLRITTGSFKTWIELERVSRFKLSKHSRAKMTFLVVRGPRHISQSGAKPVPGSASGLRDTNWTLAQKRHPYECMLPSRKPKRYFQTGFQVDSKFILRNLVVHNLRNQSDSTGAMTSLLTMWVSKTRPRLFFRPTGIGLNTPKETYRHMEIVQRELILGCEAASPLLTLSQWRDRLDLKWWASFTLHRFYCQQDIHSQKTILHPK